MRLITDSSDPFARLFKGSKSNRYIRVTDDHRIFRQLPEFAGWDTARHVEASRAYLDNAIVTERMYAHTADRALATYGSHGSLISGCVRDHFPESVKTDLRTLAHLVTRDFDRSLAHWHAAGYRLHTWRAARDTRRAL